MQTKLTSIFATVLFILVANSGAMADSGTMYVGTANGTYGFEILDNGNELYYEPQPDTPYNWYYQDGSVVTYTSGGVTAPRDGMKTFAATSVAYGQTLGSISLSFDCAYGIVDPHGFPYKGFPTMNFHITDGNGSFAIWSATSGGTPFDASYSTPVAGREGWYTISLDLTALADDSVYGKINESTNQAVLLNGNLNSTTLQWSDIKNWTIAGFYTEQFSPTGGFGAWNETLWNTISIPDDPATLENEYLNSNQYGISLVWGDTVGGMLGDGDGEVGTDAERAYGQGSKGIANVVVNVGATSYSMTFEPGVVPEPATMSLLGLGAVALIRRRK